MIYTPFFVTLLFLLKGALIRWRANRSPTHGGIDGLHKGVPPTLGFLTFWEKMSIPSIVVVGYLHFGVYEYGQSTVPVIAIASLIKIIATVIGPPLSIGRHSFVCLATSA